MINLPGITGFSFLLPLCYHFRNFLKPKFRLFFCLKFENHRETPQCLRYGWNLIGIFHNDFSAYGNSQEAPENYPRVKKDYRFPFRNAGETSSHHGKDVKRIIWKVPIWRLQGDSEIPFGALLGVYPEASPLLEVIKAEIQKRKRIILPGDAL